jgi:hypothetical protein
MASEVNDGFVEDLKAATPVNRPAFYEAIWKLDSTSWILLGVDWFGINQWNTGAKFVVWAIFTVIGSVTGNAIHQLIQVPIKTGQSKYGTPIAIIIAVAVAFFVVIFTSLVNPEKANKEDKGTSSTGASATPPTSPSPTVRPSPTPDPAEIRQRLIRRYLNPSPTHSNARLRIGLLLSREIAADLRDHVIQPAFAACDSLDRNFLPDAMKVNELSADGVYERVWNNDLAELSDLPLKDYFDYLILVKASEQTVPDSDHLRLQSLHCQVVTKIFSTRPQIGLFKTVESSLIAPGETRNSTFYPLKADLEEEITKRLEPIFAEIPAK